MTQEDEEFNRIEMESRIKQEYIRSMKSKQEQANFCERCGKQLGKNDWDIHTCTPPQPKQKQDEPVAFKPPTTLRSKNNGSTK